MFQVGELPDPEPGPGEVRVRLALSGVNPGDTKKRAGWLGSAMPFPRVVPHSDGAGRIDAVGAGVEPGRLGERVWVFGAQSYRAFGTAAECTVVPAALAVKLPPQVPEELGATLGIPGVTAHRAVFADGPVAGRTVLVQGVRGAVSSLAAQLARWAGATVIGTVRRSTELDAVPVGSADYTVALDDDPVAAVRRLAPSGVDHIVEVALHANADFDDAVAAQGAVIAAYASDRERTEVPFWTLLFNNVVLRLVGSDDVPAEAKQQAARDLTTAAATGALQVRTATPFSLEEIAAAHDAVDAGASAGRVLIRLEQATA